MNKKWNYLKAGDVVDVIAPSSYCSHSEIKSGLKYLEDLGLVVRFPKTSVKPDFVYANNAEETLKHMKTAFYSKDSKAIWCLRGGSGTFRLIPELMKWKKPKQTKIFVGLSDITLLHIFLNQKWNWPTLHGPMISMLGKKKASAPEKKSLEKIIFGASDSVVFKSLKPLNSYAQKRKVIQSKVLGGNLCLVEASLGTQYQMNFSNQIAFLEDIDERGYALERSFIHLENANVFKNAKAVVFGDFVGGEERSGKNLTSLALKRFAERLKIPVFKGIESGHGPTVKTLPLNTMSTLKCGMRGELICQTGGC